MLNAMSYSALLIVKNSPGRACSTHSARFAATRVDGVAAGCRQRAMLKVCQAAHNISSQEFFDGRMVVLTMRACPIGEHDQRWVPIGQANRTRHLVEDAPKPMSLLGSVACGSGVNVGGGVKVGVAKRTGAAVGILCAIAVCVASILAALSSGGSVGRPRTVSISPAVFRRIAKRIEHRKIGARPVC